MSDSNLPPVKLELHTIHMPVRAKNSGDLQFKMFVFSAEQWQHLTSSQVELNKLELTFAFDNNSTQKAVDDFMGMIMLMLKGSGMTCDNTYRNVPNTSKEVKYLQVVATYEGVQIRIPG